jgi:hypothetical protein
MEKSVTCLSETSTEMLPIVTVMNCHMCYKGLSSFNGRVFMKMKYSNSINLSRPGARMSWMATYSFLACGPRDQVISACGSHDFRISERQTS